MQKSEAVRRVTVRAFGGPEQLTIETVAEAPSVGLGQLLVDVEACGLNYLDIYEVVQLREEGHSWRRKHIQPAVLRNDGLDCILSRLLR